MTNAIKQLNPLHSQKERNESWRNVRGMWKHRAPDPVEELAAMRDEWGNRA